MRRKRNESGQAFVEYIMLLMISVLMVLGLAYKFNVAWCNYMEAWFVGENSYLFCIISEGLLPGDTGAYGQCPVPTFQPNVATNPNGSQPTKYSYAGSGGGNKSYGSGPSSAGYGSSGGRSGEGGKGLIPFSGADGRGGLGRGAAGSGAGSKKGGASGSYTGSDDFSSANVQQDGGGSAASQYAKSRTVPLDSKEEAATHSQKPTQIPFTDRDMKTAREISSEKIKKKQAQQEADDGIFSFGWIFRIAIIAFLLLAILFFVGSQAVAMARGSRRQR
jgi:hypothetical protein